MNRGPRPPKEISNKEKFLRPTKFLKKCVNSGTAICSTVYALPAGCTVHMPIPKCNLTELAVYRLYAIATMKSKPPIIEWKLQPGGALRVPIRFMNRAPTAEFYAIWLCHWMTV